MAEETSVMTILELVSSGQITTDEGLQLQEALKASQAQQESSFPYDAPGTWRIADLRAALSDAGVKLVDYAELNHLKNFGVTPDFVRDIHALNVEVGNIEE